MGTANNPHKMKKYQRISVLLAFVALAVPFFASAAPSLTPNIGAISPYSSAIINVINGILVPVLMAVAFIVFLWGVYNYFILGAADEKKRTDGRQFVLWGVIGFVVLFSLWGLVNIVASTLGLPLGGPSNLKPPTI